jgi:hypothetical protein
VLARILEEAGQTGAAVAVGVAVSGAVPLRLAAAALVAIASTLALALLALAGVTGKTVALAALFLATRRLTDAGLAERQG